MKNKEKYRGHTITAKEGMDGRTWYRARFNDGCDNLSGPYLSQADAEKRIDDHIAHPDTPAWGESESGLEVQRRELGDSTFLFIAVGAIIAIAITVVLCFS